MDCGWLGSSAHGIFQARMLEWLPFPVRRDLPDPGIKPMSLASPALAGRFFTNNATWEAHICHQPPAYLSSRFSFRWLQIHSNITSQRFYLRLNREVDLEPPIGSEYLLPHYLETTFIQVKL